MSKPKSDSLKPQPQIGTHEKCIIDRCSRGVLGSGSPNHRACATLLERRHGAKPRGLLAIERDRSASIWRLHRDQPRHRRHGRQRLLPTWFQCYTVGTSNLYYQTNAIVHVAGAIGDGDTALSCTRSAAGAGQYVLFPRASGGVPNPVLTLQPPFSIEFWVNPAGTVSADMPIVNEGRMPVLDPRNGYTTANWAGFSVGQYAGIAFFAMYNGTGGDSTKQELDVPITAGTWHHARGRLLVLLLCGPILQCLTALDEVCGGICCRRRLCGYASASTWNLPTRMGPPVSSSVLKPNESINRWELRSAQLQIVHQWRLAAR